MVYLKEFRKGSDIYLSVVDHKDQDAMSGTYFLTSKSLRTLEGGAASLTRDSLLSDMSMKLDIQGTDASSRYRLKSNLKLKAGTNYTYQLLGRRIISREVKWGSFNLKVYGESTYIPRYWEWTEDIIARFHDILSAASIRSAIFASLYSYDKDAHIMRAFFEAWCPDTNTLHTMQGELSISLWDLKRLGGLPIVGKIYDETVPQLSTLQERDKEGNLIIPDTCTFLFTAFHYLAKESKVKGEVSAQQWVDLWCKRPVLYPSPIKGRRTTKNPPASTQNPSGEIHSRPSDEWTKEEHSLFERLGCDDSRRAKVYLAAYLSCWLCTFVLPEDKYRTIRPATFEIASMMAEGRVFSLAVPTLASIYKGLNGLVHSQNPGYSWSYFPAHYLYGWIAHYFDTYHTVDPKPQGPCMATYSGSVGARSWKPQEARELLHEGKSADVKCFMLNKHKVEILLDNGDLSSLRLDYIASLRTSYLCLRQHKEFHLEKYDPSRFGRQFGFTQDVPGVLSRGSTKPYVSCYEALKYWQVFLLTGSMSRAYLPSPSFRWRENVTAYFTKWWNDLLPIDLKENVDILVRSTESDHKTKKRDHHEDTRNRPQRRVVPLKSKIVAPEVGGHAVDNHHSDADSEVDPKHDRRGKRKASTLDANDIRLDDQFFEGVSSASKMPSQTLDGDCGLEMASLVPESPLLHRPLKIRSGKGKELVLLDRSTPVEDPTSPASQGSQTGSSFANGSQNAVDSPASAHAFSRHIPDDRREVFKSPTIPIKPTTFPTCSGVSFRPPSSFQGIFDGALHAIRLQFLTELKDASFSDVGEVAIKARGCYESIKHLKGDYSSLQAQVDSYVGAVQAYLALEKQAAKCHRPAFLEDKKLELHRKIEHTKSLYDKAQEEHKEQLAELSVTLEEVNALEAKLKQAREKEKTLRSNLAARDASLKSMNEDLRMSERELTELDNIPILNAEEEALLQERRVQLEEMRASLDVDL